MNAQIKKYIPFAVAAVVLLCTFLISFSVTKKVKLKKLRAADIAAQSPSQAEQNSEEEPSDTPGGQKTDVSSGELAALPTPETINMPTSEMWSVVLVNVYYRINADYEPRVAKITDDILLDERVAEQYNKMAEAAKKDGVTLTVSSGYIMPARQETMYNAKVQELTEQGLTEEAAKAKAAFTVLPPRCSEANCGLSVDFEWSEGPFEESPVYAWLTAHAAEYGFIERYKTVYEKETHVQGNPCHWRYVGVDASKYLSQYDVSLEKYLGKVN